MWQSLAMGWGLIDGRSAAVEARQEVRPLVPALRELVLRPDAPLNTHVEDMTADRHVTSGARRGADVTSRSGTTLRVLCGVAGGVLTGLASGWSRVAGVFSRQAVEGLLDFAEPLAGGGE